jgi:phenylpropionate dioxygenase-like ring-hydroxylating dioxygenase large terminal subunit
MRVDNVPRERYFDRAFNELERERLWKKTWQPACRLEEIPNVGDYAEYIIRDQSILVVRSAETEVKAFFNHCRHRGNELANGAGAFRTGEMVCSFHGWRWNLDGSNAKVYAAPGFTPACLDRDRLRLAECRVGIELGMVWITMDPAAPSLREFLGGALDYWNNIRLGDMKVRWWRYMTVDANWKTVQEPFMEAYHIAQTHPEITANIGVDRFDIERMSQVYQVIPEGHGWGSFDRTTTDISRGPVDGISAIDWGVISNRALYDGIDAGLMLDWQIAIQDELYYNQGLRESEYMVKFHELLYAEADRRGVAIPSLEEGAGGGYGFLFPNIVITSGYGNAFVQRTRPDGNDPEKTIVEFWALSLPGSDHKPKKPHRTGPLQYEDWGFVLQQDLSNIEKLQRGCKSEAFSDLYFSDRYEGLILNMHRTLEGYLDTQ